MSEDKAKSPVTPSSPTSRPSAADWSDEEASTRSVSADTLSFPTPVKPLLARRAQLTVISGPNTGRAHLLREGETLLGRGKEAHIPLDDAGASRTHARILLTDDGRYLLEDLKSRNGTFVNGTRADGVEQLESGDRIHIGPNVTLSFAILDAQAERITHQLYESSVRDALTRAHNRRYLIDRLGREIAYARRHAAALSVMMLDIDHFKRVNDTLGHLAGDEVLREISALIARLIRQEDVFARFGGEEFVVLARGIERVGAGRFAERLRLAVERLEVAAESSVVRVTISLGYASLEELGEGQRTVEGLLRLADSRLYSAKSGGRNRACGD
ncbi:MAG: diguanylate cyclase [Polyangiaceae bacterium]|jgi:two-component system, cell cycle response regulator